MEKKNKGDQKQDENSEENRNKDIIVLKALVHCEGCSEKLSKCLRGFHGVEQVVVDSANQKVIVKGKMADPMKVLERLAKKYSKNVELISPRPKPQKQDNNNKEAQNQKKEHPVKIVTLKMYIHCEGCANDIQNIFEKMKGVFSVDVNAEKSQVTVRGAVEETQLVEHIRKRLGKHAEIVRQQGLKVEDDDDNNNNNSNSGFPKVDENVMFTYPPQYSTKYLYPNQIFSDENVYACSLM